MTRSASGSRRWSRWRPAFPAKPTDPPAPVPELASTAGGSGPGHGVVELDIAPNDPLLAYFTGGHGTVDLDGLELDSPALAALRAEGTRLAVPLVSQGELIGLLRLGPRRSEQDYSYDDRKLLDDLATHAAPAIRVAQLVRQQQAELRQRERIEQELKVAQLIQQQFLPRELPDLPGWQVAAYYRPARAVGGDFYDFIELPGGQAGIVVGDVADKGVPAALVMATTHSVLRAEAPRLVNPAEVLERANELLIDEMPPYMFATCLYAVLDPASGRLRFANAGHNLPYLHSQGEVTDLRATGMPLGLLPGMRYEEREATLQPGDRLLLHSDGLAEAHAPDRQMFGFPRLAKLCAHPGSGEALIDRLLAELAGFTGPGWEQEDDITLVTLQRLGGTHAAGPRRVHRAERGRGRTGRGRARGGRGGQARPAANRAPGAAQDGCGRGGPERRRARQSAPGRAARRGPCDRLGGTPGGGRHRPERRPADPGRHRARPGRQGRRPADPPRLGPVPDPQHGRRAAHLRRRRAPHGPPRHAPARSQRRRRGSGGNRWQPMSWPWRFDTTLTWPSSTSPATSTATPTPRSSAPTTGRSATARPRCC